MKAHPNNVLHSSIYFTVICTPFSYYYYYYYCSKYYYRGYGESAKPDGVDKYTIQMLKDDVIDLVSYCTSLYNINNCFIKHLCESDSVILYTVS